MGAVSPPKVSFLAGEQIPQEASTADCPTVTHVPSSSMGLHRVVFPPSAHQSPDPCTKSPPISSGTGAGDMQPSSPRCGAAHSPHNRPPRSVDALTHQSPPHRAVAAGLLLPSSFPKQQGRPAGLTSPQQRGHGSEAAAVGHSGGWEAEGPQLGVGTLGTHPVHGPDAPSPPAVT